MEALMAESGNNTARELMERLLVDADLIRKIDKALHSMVNEVR